MQHSEGHIYILFTKSSCFSTLAYRFFVLCRNVNSVDFFYPFAVNQFLSTIPYIIFQVSVNPLFHCVQSFFVITHKFLSSFQFPLFSHPTESHLLFPLFPSVPHSTFSLPYHTSLYPLLCFLQVPWHPNLCYPHFFVSPAHYPLFLNVTIVLSFLFVPPQGSLHPILYLFCPISIPLSCPLQLFLAELGRNNKQGFTPVKGYRLQ